VRISSILASYLILLKRRVMKLRGFSSPAGGGASLKALRSLSSLKASPMLLLSFSGAKRMRSFPSRTSAPPQSKRLSSSTSRVRMWAWQIVLISLTVSASYLSIKSRRRPMPPLTCLIQVNYISVKLRKDLHLHNSLGRTGSKG